MADLKQVTIEVASALMRANIDYMVIGGMANAVWGNPRSTTDVDMTVGVDRDQAQDIIDALGDQIAVLPSDLHEYLNGGLLPFEHRTGIRVDLLLSRHPYAQNAIERAVTIDMDGTPVKFCTAEDLILHKIISERERDRNDVVEIFRRQKGDLDREYLDPRVHELAVILAQPEIEQRYLAFFR